MAEANDWRLTSQERFLADATLHWSEWHASRPGWDHDHCEFCFAKFADQSLPDTLHAGYTTTESRHWICPVCFADFRERFGWQLAGEADRT